MKPSTSSKAKVTLKTAKITVKKGKKKVSDYLTDRKFSIIQKENQWVLCCGDKIIWIVGERTDNRFRIDEKTKKVTVFKMSEKATDNPLIIST